MSRRPTAKLSRIRAIAFHTNVLALNAGVDAARAGSQRDATQRNVSHAQQTADGASAMTSQMENTRRYLGELIAVVGFDGSLTRDNRHQADTVTSP